MTELEGDILTSLRCYKATYGALAEVTVHKTGLHEMIEMIGGLQNVSSPDIRRLILWWVNRPESLSISRLTFSVGQILIVQTH
jgi:hypothetical protein